MEKSSLSEHVRTGILVILGATGGILVEEGFDRMNNVEKYPYSPTCEEQLSAY